MSSEQIVHLWKSGTVVSVRIPSRSAEVMPGVAWGDVNKPMTPAYWKAAAALEDRPEIKQALCFGATLVEETVACLLGGYGITAELAAAVYEQVAAAQIVTRGVTDAAEIEGVLRRPVWVDGRLVRYRYPSQKAKFLAAAITHFQRSNPPQEDLALRNWLLQIKGVGPKTASWIVRNWLDSDEVAILDIHVGRAGVFMGLFTAHHDVATDYALMEDRFLAFSKSLEVPASALDLLIWSQMRAFRFADHPR